MSQNIQTVRIQSKCDTRANWEKENPLLLKGEVGYETDPDGKQKIGDGIKHWNELPYYDQHLIDQINNRVEKESGKGLSTNDLTDELLEKIENAGQNVPIEFGTGENSIQQIGNNAQGDQSYAGGYNSKAIGDISFAHGNNSVAVTKNSVSMGDSGLAGGRGYTYYAINTADRKIYLNMTETNIMNKNVLEVIEESGIDPERYTGNEEVPGYTVDLSTKTKTRRIYLRHLSDAQYNNLILTGVGPGYITYDIEPNTIFALWRKLESGYHYLVVSSQPDIGPAEITTGSFAFGLASHATGSGSIAGGDASIAAGQYSVAIGNTVFAGYGGLATGYYTEAIGKYTQASGYKSMALNESAHAEGMTTEARGKYSHSEGEKTLAAGLASHAEGSGTIASGDYSHAEGFIHKNESTGVETTVEATKKAAHAEGLGTKAQGEASHAEGRLVKANGVASHAEGVWLESDKTSATYAQAGAFGNYSHSEGQTTQAKGNGAHAEGRKTIAEGSYSHAEGSETKATGLASHAEGQNNTATGRFSHVGGRANTANGRCETVIGEFSVAGSLDENNKSYLFRIGNGTGEGNLRSNAMTVDWSGNVKIAGQLTDMNGNPIVGEVSKEYVTEQITEKFAEMVDSAPETLDTLNELANALGNDSNFATTVATQIGGKVDKIEGKGLSTNDFTDELLEKIENGINLKNGSGENSLEQVGNNASGNTSFAGGKSSEALGETSFVHGSSSIAITQNTAVFGSGNMVGGRGYTYYAINTADKKIYLNMTETDAEKETVLEILDTAGAIPSRYTGNEEVPGYTVDLTLTNRERRIHLRHLIDAQQNNLILTGVGPGYITYDVEEGTVLNLWRPTEAGYHYFIISSQPDIGPAEITVGSFAFGVNNMSSGLGSIAGGIGTIAAGQCSTAVGKKCFSGYGALATGYLAEAIGKYSQASGFKTITLEESAHAEGMETAAKGKFSHAEGELSISDGIGAHAEGGITAANGVYSHAEGYKSITIGAHSHAEGNETITRGTNSHAEGQLTQTSNANAHAEGKSSIAAGAQSHAEGTETNAGAHAAHSEGFKTSASGEASHAEGCETVAEMQYAHAEGYQSKATKPQSHAEGFKTTASGDNAHSEGNQTIASGLRAHAEGSWTTASGDNSHSEGGNTIASGKNSHAGGFQTKAIGENQTVIGKYNIGESDKAFIIGNGDTSTRSNALTLDWEGNLKISGNFTDGDGNSFTSMMQRLADLEAAYQEKLGQIENALEQIISIQEQIVPQYITFTYSGKDYQCLKGMTWEDLVTYDNGKLWNELGFEIGHEIYGENAVIGQYDEGNYGPLSYFSNEDMYSYTICYKNSQILDKSEGYYSLM